MRPSNDSASEYSLQISTTYFQANYPTIFKYVPTVEIIAIYHALQIILETNIFNPIILSDSKAALQKIGNYLQ